MKARFLNIPYSQLAHETTTTAANWEAWRGQVIEIDPMPFETPDHPRCKGPNFKYLSFPGHCCHHMIELDESALDHEVEAVFNQLNQPQMALARAITTLLE